MVIMECRHRSPRPLPYFTPNPLYDESTPRSPGQDASGGLPQPGLVSGPVRSAPGNLGRRGRPDYSMPPASINDQQMFKERGPWFHAANMIPPADQVRWTDSGPIRLEMHQATFAYRPWSGHFFQNQEGLHTMLPAEHRAKLTKGSNKPYITQRPRQNRLAFQRYRGQTYSQTTQVIG